MDSNTPVRDTTPVEGHHSVEDIIPVEASLPWRDITP